MDAQCSVEEICSTKFCCGASESLRSVILPRTASRCCPRSMVTLRLYRVNVKASRSSAEAGKTTPHKTQRAHRNFIEAPAASAAQLHTEQPLPRRKHSATALCQASGSKPGSRTSSPPGHAGPCLRLPELQHNPFCNQLRRSSASRVHRG